ncbi:hypothetical protein QBC34DRAFT_337219 [Podospora aff. communis PSN243]|uniref:FAD-binding PCMH-type domain-containing protein n=1 Tax=Podospora aff. communis PSN243 TaxID=3040156 RepID=A0AAV9G789_9PEZI|nr:hypothetical protein QBC34DRAFT_337219 [Podospora aff. communis PSN243]
MASIDTLKQALKDASSSVPGAAAAYKRLLTDAEYASGFDTFKRGVGWATYQNFIIPQLSSLLAPLMSARTSISVLEIGPGPESVLGYLPDHQRRKITGYTAFEPMTLFATKLQEWFQTKAPMPSLEAPPKIHQAPFPANSQDASQTNDNKYDIIIFCHSMYGMPDKHSAVLQSLLMLPASPLDGLVAVFHRDSLDLDGFVCHHTASFPSGIVQVPDDNDALDSFSAFITGSRMGDVAVDALVRDAWRSLCRKLGRPRGEQLEFAAPEIIVAFTQHATTPAALLAEVPVVKSAVVVKNREAGLRRPAAIVRPASISHVKHCVSWAIQHSVGLTVIGGGHGGSCIVPNVVAVDMASFDQVDVIRGSPGSEGFGPLVVASTGAKTGDIIGKAMAAGLTVPLGSRPSVGSGMWLQGGIGHLARLHGLTCDAIVGAVLVIPDSARVVYVGHVPSHHQPPGAVRSGNERDLLWAIRGAGTNFGIVIKVVFRAYKAPEYVVRNWVVPLGGREDAIRKIGDFGKLVARKLLRHCSADGYLYWDAGRLHLGVTTYEVSSETVTPGKHTVASFTEIFGPETSTKTVDSIGLFETEMYLSAMHGGHGGGKTSAFKRCVFLKDIATASITDALVAALESRPSPLCYLHLLHGGGAIDDVAPEASAFGCRNWDFACVVTGVWPRGQDGTATARAVQQWVYDVVRDMLPLSVGVYGADLGPDPRDAVLSRQAFGTNLPRLARLKRFMDPQNVMTYACPLPRTPMGPQLIILVTGESGAGKDFCADIWVSVFNHQGLTTARSVSISEATKREYAAATGCSFERLLRDRSYKEEHRLALTDFFQEQVRRRPCLPEEHFLSVVGSAADVDVLFITGMRDEAPVSKFWHLIPERRLIEVRVQARDWVRQARQGTDAREQECFNQSGSFPEFSFVNNERGDHAARKFAEDHLLPLVHDDLGRLADMVRTVSDFPRQGVEFRHILDIAQRPGGLALCTSLLKSRFARDWANVDAIVCCEAGGFIFASALGSQMNVRLTLVRRAGKLPPPTVSVGKTQSHISGLTCDMDEAEETVEIERGVIVSGASVVVVDDVLATGKTLCAVLRVLNEMGVPNENVSVLVVAEFPVHRGRQLLLQKGFGNVGIRSLLVFGGV